MASSERFVLGRSVASDVGTLLTDIETMYGCEVVFKPSANPTPYLGGQCTVRSDGTPEIEINEQNLR